MNDSLWIGIAGALLSLTVVVGMLLRLRGQRPDKANVCRSLGFTPMEAPPELVERMARLYVAPSTKSPAKGAVRLTNVSRKRGADGDYFLLDVIDDSSEESTGEVQAIAVLSSRLNLPSFVMLPKLGGTGVFAKLAAKTLAWVASKFGEIVPFEEVPEFDTRYSIASHDPDGTRRFLDRATLRSLAEAGSVGIRAGGDLFVLSRFDHRAGGPTPERLATHLETARSVHTAFLNASRASAGMGRAGAA